MLTLTLLFTRVSMRVVDEELPAGYLAADRFADSEIFKSGRCR
jgi:hypothetical protein